MPSAQIYKHFSNIIKQSPKAINPFLNSVSVKNLRNTPFLPRRIRKLPLSTFVLAYSHGFIYTGTMIYQFLSRNAEKEKMHRQTQSRYCKSGRLQRLIHVDYCLIVEKKRLLNNFGTLSFGGISTNLDSAECYNRHV